MPQTVTVFGAGLVGSAIIRDLAASGLRVHAVDLDGGRLASLGDTDRVETTTADATDPASVNDLLKGSDLAVCAVPGHLGFRVMQHIIAAGSDVVDISFFPEDALELDDAAREAGVTAIVDCGVAPGLCNMQAGYTTEQMDRVDRYLCLVGGLPQTRTWPWEYKAVFSPSDVLEEYTRPARYVEHGEVITVPALTDIEPVDLPGVDTLEAFNTDGLRSLMQTLDIPDMKEKTLRYPGHAELMRILRESGFLAADSLEVDGQTVSPLALTSRLLFDAWKMREDDRDLTVMRVEMDGMRSGESWTWTFDLLDTFDEASGIHSMARTTGYTCTAAVHLVLNGQYSRAGISPPEYVGRKEGCYQAVVEHLRDRGVNVRVDMVQHVD